MLITQVGLLDHFMPYLDMEALDGGTAAVQEQTRAQLSGLTELLQVGGWVGGCGHTAVELIRGGVEGMYAACCVLLCALG